METEPKISVIIPVYNVEKYLRHCLDSVCNQTLHEIEIICINDGSTDASLQILSEYSARDDRITVLQQENSGMAIARNAGLSIARADYIMFVDSDDYLALNALEILYTKMIEYKPDVVVCHVQNVIDETLASTEKGKSLAASQNWFESKRLASGLYPVALNKKAQFVSVPWNKLYKHDIIRKYNITFPPKLNQEDEFWLWAYMIHCKTFYFVDEKLYYYVRRIGSVMDALYSTPIALDIFDQCKNIYENTKRFTNIIQYKDVLAQDFIAQSNSRKKRISPSLYPQFLEKIREYALYVNASYCTFEFYKQIKQQIGNKIAEHNNHS